jgi:hypothetical protein
VVMFVRLGVGAGGEADIWRFFGALVSGLGTVVDVEFVVSMLVVTALLFPLASPVGLK